MAISPPTYSIYTLADVDGAARYIGLTVQRPATRLVGHCTTARAGASTPLSLWVRSLLTLDRRPVLCVLESHATLADASAAEMRLIAAYRAAGHALLNVTAGGIGLLRPATAVAARMAASKAAGRLRLCCAHCARPFERVPSQPGRFCSVRCARAARRRPLADRFWEKVDKSGACWLWTATVVPAGYGTVWDTDRRRNMLAHRVAWELTHGPISAGLWVCHNCPGGDNPRCVNPAHLWLGTSAQNTADRHRKGRDAAGERHSSRTHPERVPRGAHHGSRTHPERVARGDNNGRRLHPERYPTGAAHPTRTHPELLERMRAALRLHPERRARGLAHGAYTKPECVPRGEGHGRHKLTAEQVREIRARYAAGNGTQRRLGRQYGVSKTMIRDIVTGKRRQHLLDDG